MGLARPFLSSWIFHFATFSFSTIRAKPLGTEKLKFRLREESPKILFSPFRGPSQPPDEASLLSIDRDSETVGSENEWQLLLGSDGFFPLDGLRGSSTGTSRESPSVKIKYEALRVIFESTARGRKAKKPTDLFDLAIDVMRGVGILDEEKVDWEGFSTILQSNQSDMFSSGIPYKDSYNNIDKLREENLSCKKVSNSKKLFDLKNTTPTPLEEIHPLMKIWNENRESLPLVIAVSPKRRKSANALLREIPDLTYWVKVVKRMASSDFCCGRTEGSKWVAHFDWFIRADTHLKVMEGRYDNRGPRSGGGKLVRIDDLDAFEKNGGVV